MKTNVFTVYDSKAEAYLPPFFVNTKGEAIRAFSDCCNDKNHQFGQHAADYTLFELGSYSYLEGCFNIHETKVSLGNGVEYQKTVQLPEVAQVKQLSIANDDHRVNM